MVARCNNRGCYVPAAEGFDRLFAYVRELVRTYAITVYAYGPGGTDEKLESGPRRIKELRPNWCPVPFFPGVSKTVAAQCEQDELERACPKPGAVQRRGTDNAEMLFIPAGTFTMGDTHGGGGGDEKPAHQVTVAPFWLDKAPVTNAQFTRFVQATGYKAKGKWQDCYTRGKDTHPVVNVTWSDALAYCTWAGKHLPTEAEWEYAARGTDGRKYPWGNEWEISRANSKESIIKDTTPVG